MMTDTVSANGRAIHVEQATLKTATVTIQAMVVDRRQVTLALFRQLLGEAVVDYSGSFNGLPWGAVNYCPDKAACAEAEKRSGQWAENRVHLHVVWQKGGELRRALETPPRAFAPWIPDQEANEWMWLALAEGWWPSSWERGPRDYRPNDERAIEVTFVDDLPAVLCSLPQGEVGSSIEFAVGMRAVDETTAAGEEGWEEQQRTQRQAALTRGRALIGQLRTEASVEERGRRIEAQLRVQHRAWQERAARWQELQDLPQLFIAT
jgi:hypothetical protein